MRIKIVTEATGEVQAEIAKEINPKTAEAVLNALPIESRVSRWGEEVYFETPVNVGEEKSQTVVDVGDIAYWPPGNAFCVFFGPTPMSKGDEPKAYSPVNVIGKVLGDPFVFKKVKSGDKIRVAKA